MLDLGEPLTWRLDNSKCDPEWPLNSEMQLCLEISLELSKAKSALTSGEYGAWFSMQRNTNQKVRHSQSPSIYTQSKPATGDSYGEVS